jgi:hypothetical protein
MKPHAAPEGSPLRQRLAGLRRRLRFVASFRGVSWLLTAVLATAVVAGLLDWTCHLPGLVRAFLLTGVLTGAGMIVHRFLVRPLSAPADDLSLALRIEERYPILNDALASTVQFLDRESPPEGESAGMRREAVRRTLGKAGGMDFNRVVDSRGLWTSLSCSLTSLACVAVLFAVWPGLVATAFARLANPFGPADWPTRTRIELEDFARRVGRNKEFVVSGHVRGVVPGQATAEIAFEKAPPQRRTLEVDRKNDGAFTLRLGPGEVVRNFRFRVLANDAATHEYGVEVQPLPVLVNLDGKPSPQVRLDYPRYTDLPPERLPPGSRTLKGVAGTVVTLRAAADRPLSRAWVDYQPELRETLLAAFLAPVGSEHPLGGLASALAVKERLDEVVPAELGPDRRTFQVRFRPSLRGSCTLHFADEKGLENSLEYELRLHPDPAPVVRLARPSPSRDQLNVLPTAYLPLELVVEDPEFAVRSVTLEYRTQPAESPRVLTLYHHAQGVSRDLAPLAGGAVLAAPAPRLRPQRLEFSRSLSLGTLRHASGAALKEGDVVLLQACADDFDDVSGAKEPGRSHVVEIKIVGRDVLEALLNQEQGRVQQELVRLREKEREALAKVAEVEARLRKGGKVNPEREAAELEQQAQKKQDEAAAEEEKAEKAAGEEADERRKRAARLRKEAQELATRAERLRKQATQLGEAEQTQREIRERVGDRKEGLRAEVARLLETLRQNGLEHSNAMARMKMVADDLDRLAERELEAIEPKLVNARQQAELLDEKAQQQRQEAMRRQAKQAELEADAAQARAKQSAEQARAAEDAARSANGTEKAQKQAEAKRLREQAEQEQQKAADKRRQAERDRREAEQKPDPDRARQALADARRGQEEVERSLGALLQRLEPWSSTREIKGEAGRILQEQRELQAKLEALDQKGLTGKTPEELNQRERAELETLEDAQRRLQERTAELVDKMKRVAENRAEKDPQTSKELREAAGKAEEGNLPGRMKEAGESIKQNKLNEAKDKQRRAVAELEKLVKNLEDRREAELDRLARKLRAAEEKVEELQDEQERLQKKLREAAKIADPAEREKELARLSRQQKALREKTEEVMKQLSRLGNDQAREALGRAGEEMQEAEKQLSRGTRDDGKQEDVLDQLEGARRELERSRKRADEELGREQLARVADVIRRLRERQEGHVEEAKRIQDLAQQRGTLGRGLKGSLTNLGRNQRGLGEETAAVAKKELSAAPVFARMLERAARAMDQAGARLGAMAKDQPPIDALPDEEAGRLQRLALRRLGQLLDSLKESQEEPAPLSRAQGEDGGAEEDAGPPGDDSLPPMAQLKMLRSMQKEVNERTEAFRKKHPNPERLLPKEKAELQEIRREQKEVADLLERLTQPPGEEPDGPDEGMDDKAEKADKAGGAKKAPEKGEKP